MALSAKEEERLLDKFRPILRFDAVEEHFPLTPETFVEHADLWRKRRKIKGEEKEEDTESIDTDSSAEQPGKYEWELVPPPEGSGSWTLPEVLSQQDEKTFNYKLRPHEDIRCGQESDIEQAEEASERAPPCFGWGAMTNPFVVHPLIRHSGKFDKIVELKYAFLYSYNGTTFIVPGTVLGVHEGDIEHITVRVALSSDESQEKLLEVFFAAHSSAEGKWVPHKDFLEEVVQLEESVMASSERTTPTPSSPTSSSPPLSGEEAACTPPKRVADPLEGKRDLLTVNGNHPVVFPARRGHASYPKPARWRRLFGLGDDISMGDGKEWRPRVIRLDKENKKPDFLGYAGKFGTVSNLPFKSYYRNVGEQIRKCNPKLIYRSLLEEGCLPDRGIKIGMNRLNISPLQESKGLVLSTVTQTQHALFGRWVTMPAVDRGVVGGALPPPSKEWVGKWTCLRDCDCKTTDGEGWGYSGSGLLSDAGHDAKERFGLRGSNARRRTWVRVAASPEIASAISAESSSSSLESVALLAAHAVAAEKSLIPAVLRRHLSDSKEVLDMIHRSIVTLSDL